MVETIPRPTAYGPLAGRELCDDLAILVSPAGDLDVFYAHPPARQMQPQEQVVHAHRAAGTSEWKLSIVVDSLAGDNGSAIHGVGCRVRAEYEDTGKPAVVVLEEWHVSSPPGELPERRAIGYALGGGRLLAKGGRLGATV